MQLTTVVIVASESYLLRQGIIAAVSSMFGGVVIKEAGHFAELDMHINKTIRCLAIVDGAMIQRDDYPELLKKIIEFPELKVLVLTTGGYNDALDEHQMYQIQKNTDRSTLEEKLNELITVKHTKSDQNGTLSEREIEVLKKVALGLTNKEISEQLYISPHTVITHRKNITAKLGIKTISGLTVYAILNNIIKPDELNQNQ